MSDKRRAEAVVKYNHVVSTNAPASASFITSSLPMVAMFMRNKIIAWSSLFVAVQSLLNETPASRAAAAKNSSSASQPASMTVIISIVALITCYADFIFPQKTAVSKAAEAVVTATTTALST